MSKENSKKGNDLDTLQLLVNAMQASLVVPKAATNDQLCQQLSEELTKPNAFRKRVVKRRRELGADDGILGSGDSGSGKAAGSTNSPKPKRRKS